MNLSSNRHPVPALCLSMISAQTLRVCREGKPLHTFPDHALPSHLAGFGLEAVERGRTALLRPRGSPLTFAKPARSGRLALGEAREAAVVFAVAGQAIDRMPAVGRSGGPDRDEGAGGKNRTAIAAMPGRSAGRRRWKRTRGCKERDGS